MRTSSLLVTGLALLLAGCGGGTPAAEAGAERQAEVAAAQVRWQANPAEGVQLSADSGLVVQTGPHAILWERDAVPLAPPYAVEATLRKRAGRLHEGYGLIFGGDSLAAPEAEQHYSYFLVRGDGSYLIKRREGADTPIVRDWTANRAVRRDAGDVGEPNRLRVVVGAEEVVFSINGSEVARVPAGELRTEGLAGLRVAHNLELLITDFTATPTAP